MGDILGGGRGYAVYSASRALTPHPNRCRGVIAQKGLRLALAPSARRRAPSWVSLSPAQTSSGGEILLRVRNAEPCNRQAVRLRAFILRRYSSVFCRLGREVRWHRRDAPGSPGCPGSYARRSLAPPPWFRVRSSNSRSAAVHLHPLCDARAERRGNQAPATSRFISAPGSSL